MSDNNAEKDPFGHSETTFIACEVFADVVNPNSGFKGQINGVLSVVEKVIPHFVLF